MVVLNATSTTTPIVTGRDERHGVARSLPPAESRHGHKHSSRAGSARLTTTTTTTTTDPTVPVACEHTRVCVAASRFRIPTSGVVVVVVAVFEVSRVRGGGARACPHTRPDCVSNGARACVCVRRSRILSLVGGRPCARTPAAAPISPHSPPNSSKSAKTTNPTHKSSSSTTTILLLRDGAPLPARYTHYYIPRPQWRRGRIGAPYTAHRACAVTSGCEVASPFAQVSLGQGAMTMRDNHS